MRDSQRSQVYGSDDPLRNVVHLYEKYVNLLPANSHHPSLYKYALKKPKPNQWYSDNQLGQNALAKIVKSLCDQAGLTGEKFCNQSPCNLCHKDVLGRGRRAANSEVYGARLRSCAQVQIHK